MAEKPAPPKITDAEFEVVVDAPTSIPLLVSGLIAGILVLAVAAYFGAQTESAKQAPYLGAAGAGFAGAVRAAWKLFPALRRQRSAAKGEGNTQARQRIPHVRD